MDLTVDGQKVFAATGGKPFDPAQPCVLFIHGAGNDHTVWHQPARYFAYHGRSVLAPDLPGHGRSEGAALGSIEAMADWVAAVIEKSGASRTTLVGHSMGALIAIAAAAKMGAAVEGLALLGVAGRIPVHPDLLAAAAKNDHVAYEFIVSWGFGPAAQYGGHRAPGLWMTGAGMRLLEQSRDGVFAADLKACDDFTTTDALAATIACPTLFILGARDRLTPVKGARALAERFPTPPRIVTLTDCGHMMLSERPDETLDALREGI